MTKRKLKYFAAGVMVAAVLALVVQNSGNTSVNFLFMNWRLPTLVLILGAFLMGVFVGAVMVRRR